MPYKSNGTWRLLDPATLPCRCQFRNASDPGGVRRKHISPSPFRKRTVPSTCSWGSAAIADASRQSIFCAMADWRDLSFSSWLCVMKNNTTELEMTRLISAVRIAILALLGIGPLYLTIALALSAPASATQARSRTSKPSARQITCNWWACRPVAKGCRLVKPYREHFGDPSNGVEVCKDGSGRHRLDTPS